MTSKDKKDTPEAAKAEPLKDAELAKAQGGVWGLESNFVKGTGTPPAGMGGGPNKSETTK
jgi:hypothetical protein